MGEEAIEVMDEPTATAAVEVPEEVASAELVVHREREASVPAANVLPSPAEWEATLAVAQKIASTPFVPESYRGQPEAVVAAILYGRELGIGPMQALRQIHMIDGRPTLAAELMLSQMRKGGVVIIASGVNDEKAWIVAKRQDTGEEAEVEWTYADAEAAKLTWKTNWQTYRHDMLWARVVGRLARRLGSDLLGGMVYSKEEVEDWDDAAGSYPQTVVVTSWQHPDFDPAVNLDVAAPASIDDVLALIRDLDPTLSDWIAEGVLAVYGATYMELTPADQTAAARRIANAVGRVRDECFADGDFPPPSEDDYREIFTWAFDGHVFEGPPDIFEGDAGSDADVAAADEALAAADAEFEPVEPDLLSDAKNASQGHVGTGEPDL